MSVRQHGGGVGVGGWGVDCAITENFDPDKTCSREAHDV